MKIKELLKVASQYNDRTLVELKGSLYSPIELYFPGEVLPDFLQQKEVISFTIDNTERPIELYIRYKE